MKLTPDEFRFIQQLVHERSAIILADEKEYLVHSRLEPLAASLGFPSLRSFIHCLQATSFGDYHRRTVEAMTTNETSFFRDQGLFDVLRDVVIPQVIANRNSEKAIHIWCGACASGQEPYSVAMLLKEYFPELVGWTIQIIATDYSRSMIVRAGLGEFSCVEVNRGLPKKFLDKYFVEDQETWRIQESVRRMITFQEMNLIDSWKSFPAMDLVLLRNVLIYFNASTKKRILGRVRNILSPNGYLVLGGSETVFECQEEFQRVGITNVSVYQRSSLSVSHPSR